MTDFLKISDEIQSIIHNSPNRPIAEMNFIEFFNPSEPETSSLLEILFSYKNRDGEYQIFKSFAENFLMPLGFDLQDIHRPEVHREDKHIDLWIVESGKYAVIFENKLKGACFQRNQLARYLQTIRNMGFRDNQIFLVLLPKDKEFQIDWIPQSVWRLPKDGLDSSNNDRSCKLNDSTCCWCDDSSAHKNIEHCRNCKTDIKKTFLPHTVTLGTNFSQWMIELEQQIESRERNVRSALLQFADYLDYLYNNRLNTLMKKEIDRYIEIQLTPTQDKEGWKSLRNKLKELDELRESIKRIRREVSRNMIDQWYNYLKDKWPGMTYVRHESFGYIIDKNIWVGCKFYYQDEDHRDAGDDDHPFWGIKRTDDQKTDDQIQLAKDILSRCEDLKGRWDDPSYIVWDNTLSGDKRCDQLFYAARELGYL